MNNTLVVGGPNAGANAIAALNRKPVPLYSDLLLHDVGTGDGIAQEAAQPGEIRTPALWGLRFRRPLLHDGSAMTTMDAINRLQIMRRDVTSVRVYRIMANGM